MGYQIVNGDELSYILSQPYNASIGNYLFRDEQYKVRVACDNSTGDMFIEEFKDKNRAIEWLIHKDVLAY